MEVTGLGVPAESGARAAPLPRLRGGRRARVSRGKLRHGGAHLPRGPWAGLARSPGLEETGKTGAVGLTWPGGWGVQAMGPGGSDGHGTAGLGYREEVRVPPGLERCRSLEGGFFRWEKRYRPPGSKHMAPGGGL